MLKDLEGKKEEDELYELWFFCGWHVFEGNEAFVAQRRTGEQSRCKEDIIHIIFEVIIFTLDKIPSLQTKLLRLAFFTLLAMLVQLPSLASSASIKREGKQLEKGHVQHLSEAYLPIAATEPLQGHQISEGKREVFEVIGELIDVKSQDCDCPADMNKVPVIMQFLSECIPKCKDDKVKYEIRTE